MPLQPAYPPVKPVLLLVHIGDVQMRGSERCLLNLIKGIDTNRYDLVLWSNHKELSAQAEPFLQETLLTEFSPPFGFSYPASGNSAWADFSKLVHEGRALIDRIQPSLIVCNSLAPCQWMVPASLLTGVPLLAYLHTNYLPKSRLLSFVYGASHIVGVSQFTLKELRGDGYPQRHSSVVYNGVEDLSPQPHGRLAFRQKLGISSAEFVVTSLCALVEWKKVDLVIEAFRLLSRNGANPCALLVIGEGPCKENLQKQADGLRVIFCGWRTDIADILAATDCIAVAAEREAFGLTVTEAASMNVPVVGARSGGLCEVIKPGMTGLFAEPGSATSFADALAKLRDNPHLRAKLGQNARSDYIENYKVEKMVSNMTVLIDKFSSQAHSNSSIKRLANLVYFNLHLVLRKIFKY